jgi:hypothetical protein
VPTVVDICNLALSRLGDEATVSSIDPPEGSVQATHCARFYPMALDACLDEHYWSFCTVRGSLALLSAAPAFGWTYAYAEPNKCNDIIGIYLPGAPDDKNPQPFEVEALDDGTTVIYTNVQNAAARYTVRVDDPAKYPALFVDALVLRLMAYLAGPVVKGMEGVKMSQSCLQLHLVMLAKATESDTSQRKVTLTHNPEHLRVRDTCAPGVWER